MKILFEKDFIFIFSYVCVLSVCGFVHMTLGSHGGQRCRALRTRVTGSCEPPIWVLGKLGSSGRAVHAYNLGIISPAY